MFTLIIESLVTKHNDIRPHIDARDNDGDTPLMWAIEKRLTTQAGILIDLGNTQTESCDLKQ